MNKIEELAMSALMKTKSWENRNYTNIIEDYRYFLAHYAMIANNGVAEQAKKLLRMSKVGFAKWLGVSGRLWMKENECKLMEIECEDFYASVSVKNLKRDLGLEILEMFEGNSLKAEREVDITRAQINRWAQIGSREYKKQNA